MENKRDYYEVLGVSAATSAGESLRAHGVAELVVARALVGVGEHLICFGCVGQ